MPPDTAADQPVMLVIGNLGRWEAMGRSVPRIDNCHFVSPEDLTAELLDRVAPTFAVSALMDIGIDAMEIAQVLAGLGFDGAYRAIIAHLPNLPAVRAEVRAAAPGLDFDIVLMGG